MTLIDLTGENVLAIMGRVWWPFLRISALFYMMPLIGDRMKPVQVRILLALAISVLLAPMMPTMPAIDPFSAEMLVVSLQQILLGLMLGVMLRILFGVMTMLGQILSMQMGLAMGIMNDPSSGSVPLLSQLMLFLASFLFLIANGHLIAIDIVIESFFTWKVGQSLFDLELYRVLGLFGWMFGSALILAIPAVVAMLTVNITFGVMNRSAPSLNAIALGFPLAMMMGLISILLTLAGIPSRYNEFTNHALDQMRLFVQGVPL